jgi:SAM-dependent methyltransferase
MIETLEQRIKRYWNAQPCNVKHSKNEPGTLDFFRDVSARRYRVEPHIPEFAGFHLWQGKRVLEIGPGIGSDAAEFARAGAEYYAIDYSDASVELARQRFKVEELEGSLNEEIQKGIELKKQLLESKKEDTIRKVCEGLTQTQFEKVKTLAESVDFTAEGEYEGKIKTIRENYFGSTSVKASSESTKMLTETMEQEPETKKVSDPGMSAYVQAIKRSLPN